MQIIRDFLAKNGISETTFALGVSGGADSLALALMFRFEFQDYRIIALTVDHKLRPTSGKEALYVADVMRRFGIEHRILVWEGEKPVTGIEEHARVARYNLLCSWCRNNGIKYLATAHHLYDQAETFLMHLQRGSGLYGLSGMSEVSEKEGIKILRPLLNIPPQRLKEFLVRQNISWIEDESNTCTDFLRVKMRYFLSPLEQNTQISPERIGLAAANLERTRCFMEELTDKMIDDTVHKWWESGFSVDFQEFTSWHQELKYHILGKLICRLGCLDYVPETEKMFRILKDIEKHSFKSATLGGCFIQRSNLKLWIIREIRETNMLYTVEQWRQFERENPEVRGLNIPHKLRHSLIIEKYYKKI